MVLFLVRTGPATSVFAPTVDDQFRYGKFDQGTRGKRIVRDQCSASHFRNVKWGVCCDDKNE